MDSIMTLCSVTIPYILAFRIHGGRGSQGNLYDILFQTAPNLYQVHFTIKYRIDHFSSIEEGMPLEILVHKTNYVEVIQGRQTFYLPQNLTSTEHCFLFLQQYFSWNILEHTFPITSYCFDRINIVVHMFLGCSEKIKRTLSLSY